jgi:adenylosuccinate synthase
MKKIDSKSTSIVVGLGYGDEGKGLVTDWLASQKPNDETLVIRFSGGHQAGHTVTLQNTVSHVFSNFGSGTLRGTPTLWSKYCTVNPIYLLNEYKILFTKSIEDPVLYIDEDCPITTPFDVWHNELRCNTINGNFISSVGVGFGDTIQREEDHYHLVAKDLAYPNTLRYKLQGIARYYGYYEEIKEEIENFIVTCNKVRNIARIISSDATYELVKSKKNIIFEGSQGILLDQKYGFFPYVTRSNTTSENAINMCFEHGLLNPEIYYVTRCYATRHGNGPLFAECKKEDIIMTANPNETNVHNACQGEFRYGIIDREPIEYALDVDKLYHSSFTPINIIITCIDQLYKNMYDFRKGTPLATLLQIGGFNSIYVSTGPFAEHITKLKY